MKVAIWADVCFNQTGMGRGTNSLIRELFKQDRKNEYTLFHSANHPEDCLTQHLGHFHNVRSSRLPYSRRSLMMNWLFLSRMELSVLIGPHDIYFNPCAYYIPISDGQFTGLVWDLCTIFSPQSYSFQMRWIANQGRKSLIRNSSTILAISESTKNDLCTHYGISGEKIRIAYLGVEEHFQEVSSEVVETIKRKFRIRSPYIFWCGEIQTRKNVVLLVKAFHQFLQTWHGPVQLVLSGGIGYRGKEVLKLISQLGLENDVVLTGPLGDSDLVPLYNGAHLFAFPSLYEGFGLPVLESMACGTPVIASNVSSLPEIVESAGLLVPPADVDAWVNAFRELFQNDRLYERLSQLGRKRAKSFTWSTMARTVLDTFGNL